jgi:uncharacterized membrane protein (Fun14 family)
MLFLFRGRYGTAVKAAVGIALLVAGLVIHGGIVLVLIGAVLIVWSALSGLTQLRARRGDTGRDGS